MPRPRGKAQHTLRLIEAARRILAEIQPATVRAVCYRLFVEGVIASMAKTETNRVSAQLTDARERGWIPWEWIVDETREAERSASWADADGYMATLRRDYRRDHWALQPTQVEVWSEKGTVRGTLAPVLEEYGVTFRVMHGYASATTVHEVAEAQVADPRPLTVLYVGDWDPSGLHMSEVDLPTRLAEYWREARARSIADAGGDPHGVLQLQDIPDFDMERVALTEDDVLAGTLPPFDADSKRSDSRWAWYREEYGERCGGQCWELDALSPVVLRERAEATIKDLINWPTWNRSLAAEAAEAHSLQLVLDRWNRGRRRR